MTRRGFLKAASGGVAAAAAVWAVSRRPAWLGTSGAADDLQPVGDVGYVDHDGWMVTTTDKERLAARREVTPLDDIALEGRDLDRIVAADADDCLSRCRSDERCRAFTYADATHPDAALRGSCTLKASADVPRISGPFYTSGLVAE